MTDKLHPFTAQEELDAYRPHSRPLGELYAQAMEELAKPYPSMELPSWKGFNKLTGGFRTREFTILCGSTGSGKTTLLANWAQQLMLAGKRCFIMSVETGPTDFIKRTMGAYIKQDINRGQILDPKNLQIFHKQYGHVFTSDDLFLSLYDNRINHTIVMRDIIWHREKKNCEVVFIDNLNFLMEVCSANQQIEMMDRVVHDLIMLVKRTDVHLVMVMHPKKTENGTRVESEFDIKGSSTAVQEAHNVFLFNRPKVKDVKDGKRGPFLRELTIRKLRRRGDSIGKSLWLEYQGANYNEISIEESD